MDSLFINKHYVKYTESINEGVKLIMTASLFSYRPNKPVVIFQCGKIRLTWEIGKIGNKLEKSSNLPLTKTRNYELLLNGIPILNRYESKVKDYTYEYFNSCIIPYDSIEDIKSKELMKKYIDKIEMMRTLNK